MIKTTAIPAIDSIELYIVKLPLIRPFETSFSVQTHREAMLLRLTAGDTAAWGECVAGADPYYSYETNETAMHIIKGYLAPLLLQQKEELTVEGLMDSYARVRGHNMAKAAVENALLNLLALLNEVPLYQLIGGENGKIMSGISIGIKDKIDDLLVVIDEAVRRKYHRIKIKIKRGRDVEVLRAVRENFPDVSLMADANADYSLKDADHLAAFDEYNLMMIEQPLNYEDIYYHSLLQKQLKTAICLDESIKNLDDARTAVDLKSCRIINIKQGRVGGILAARAIQDFCMHHAIKVWSGGMLETGIGRAFNIHLQSLPGFTLPGDTSETSRYFREDIVDKPVVLGPDGMIDIPQGNGIGVEVIRERLDYYKVHYERL